MSQFPEEDFQMDTEDGWNYSIPPSLESLPLVNEEAEEKRRRSEEEGEGEDDQEQNNNEHTEEDGESMISELEHDNEVILETTPSKAKLTINTTLAEEGDVRVVHSKSEAIAIKNGGKQSSTESLVTATPQPVTLPRISSVAPNPVIKSTPAGPLTTMEDVHHRLSPSKTSFFESSSLSSDRDRYSDELGSSIKASDALYQLQQTMSANSISSSRSSGKAEEISDNGKLSSSADGDTTEIETKLPVSASNTSFFSNFRTVAQSMLQSPSGSHIRNASDSKLLDSLTIPSTPVTPVQQQQHRRTVSGTSPVVQPVLEEGEFKIIETPEHHPEIISYRRGKRTKSSSVSSVNGSTKPVPQSATSEASSPTTPSSAGYDKNLYIDEFYRDTTYRYATLKRNAFFHSLFPSIPVDDRLLDDFSCALSREILIQGRIYISESHLAFNSNILGWVTNLTISFKDVINIEKKATAGLFNNGITIEPKDAKHFFATFISRDATFEFFNTVWEKVEKSPSETSSIFKNRKWRLKYKTDGIGLIDYEKNSSSDKDDSDNSAEMALAQERAGGREFDDDDVDLQNMALSIDGDTPRVMRSEMDIFDPLNGESFALKPDCGYKNDGPVTHAPTKIEYNAEENGEVLLFLETINAPPGVVFDIIFGENTDFHQHLMEMSDGSKFSSYSKFATDDIDGIAKRSFTYTKALGYSIGPKSTEVNVSEQIVKKDYDSNVNVLTTSCTPNVPSGNVFTVNNRYVLAWGPQNTTVLQLSYFVKWTGKSWIKGVIETQTSSGQKEVANLLLKELKAKLSEIVITSEESLELKLKSPQAVTTQEATTLRQKFEEEIEEVGQSIQSISQEISASVPKWLRVMIVFVVLLQLYIIWTLKANSALLQKQIETNNLLISRLEARTVAAGAANSGGQSIAEKLFGSSAKGSDENANSNADLDKQIELDSEYINGALMN